MALAFVWAGLSGPGGAPAQAAEAFRLEGSATLHAPVQAVAINADESLIAAATGEGDAAGAVILLDRRSGSPLGMLRGDVGPARRVDFSPQRDLLLIWGQTALELWNISVSALKPGRPLGEEHRVWRQDAPEGQAPAGAAFALVPQAVLWSAGGRLYRRGTTADSLLVVQPLLASGETVGGFAPAPGGEATATFPEGGKTIRLYSGEPPHVVAELNGHRFPVAALRYAPGGPLLSVDSGRNLIVWHKEAQPRRIDFLKALPENAVPAALLAPADDKLALLLREGETWRLAVLEGAERKPLGTLEVPAPPRVGLSPTARYVVTGEGSEVKVFVFAHPVSPVDYVRRLREWGAMSAALGYARHLDPEAVPAHLRRQLEQELNRVPSERVLAELLERLREALEAEEPAAIQQWADQVLSVQPGHPEAVAALARVQGLRERQVLAEARDAYESGLYRRAIDLLANRIPPASEHAGEAAQLIRLAEAKRDLQTTLQQARERMEAGLYDAAETLVNEALRHDPRSREALLLQGEIRGRSGSFLREMTLLGFGVLMALGALGFLLHRYRGAWRALLRPLSLDHDPSLRQSPLGAERTQAHPRAAEGEPLHARASTTREEAAPRAAKAGLARALRMEEARRTLDKAEQLLRLCRHADRYQEHTAWFLELEAELNTMARRLNDPHGDPERPLLRLNKILSDLRNVKFQAPRSDPPPAGAAEEPSHYELLRVSAGASEAEIRSAYHRLIKEYHPDRHSTSEYGWIKEESERMTKKLSEAYQVLSDTARREQYDRELARRRRAAPGAAP